jgi:hypothetical protein
MADDTDKKSDEVISGTSALLAAAFLGMSIFCLFLMLFFIWTMFLRKTGLYFWSILITTVSELSLNFSAILYFWILKDSLPGVTLLFSAPSYISYVLFEFLVLYSRLHLLSASQGTLRLVLALILIEVIVIEIPMSALLVYITRHSTNGVHSVYRVWYQAESVIYVVLDVFLSSLYIWHVWKMWGIDKSSNQRRVLRHVVVMGVFLITIDICYLVVAFIVDSKLALAISVRFCCAIDCILFTNFVVTRDFYFLSS